MIEVLALIAITVACGVALAPRLLKRAADDELGTAWREVASELGLHLRGGPRTFEVSGVYDGLRIVVRQYVEHSGKEHLAFFFVVRAHLPPPRGRSRTKKPRPRDGSASPYRAPAHVTANAPPAVPRVSREIQLFDGWAEREYQGLLHPNQLAGVLDEVTTAARVFMGGEYELVD